MFPQDLSNTMGLTAKRFSVVDANRYSYILSRIISISMDEMRKWLMNYERMRFKSNTPNESWISSKYDIQGFPWQELQQIYLPELGMCWGPACYLLKKLWKAYKIAGRSGEPRGDIAYKINRVQAAMGIERAQFPELEGMPYENEDLDQDQGGEGMTAEEIQLQREEREYSDNWGWKSGYE